MREYHYPTNSLPKLNPTPLSFSDFGADDIYSGHAFSEVHTHPIGVSLNTYGRKLPLTTRSLVTVSPDILKESGVNRRSLVHVVSYEGRWSNIEQIRSQHEMYMVIDYSI